MKRIRFKEIALMSYSGVARRINLNNDLVILAGGNESGKSSILKSLYHTLGATVHPFAQRWDEDNVISLLKFTVDEANFKAVRLANDVYVFNPDGTSRFHETDRQKIAVKINELLGIPPFHKDNSGNEITLPVGCLFMPFYIDQDYGWDQPWNSLLRLNGGKHNAMMFHVGAINEEYYSYKSLLDIAESKLKGIVDEIMGSNRFKNTFLSKYKDVDKLPFTDEDFQRGIEDVLFKLSELKEEQNKILQELEKLYGVRYSYQFNINQLKENIIEIDKDFKYALKSPHELCCPMCGAMVENGPYERFRMLDDRDRCKNLLIENNRKLEQINVRIGDKERLSDNIKKKIEELQQSINARSERVSLEEMFIDKMKEHVETVMTDTVNALLLEKTKLEKEITNYKNHLKRVSKDDVRKTIQKEFDNYMRSTLRRLGLGKSESQKHYSLGSKVKTTGSNIVKMVVAYTYAYFHVMLKHDCPIFAPIVIDEPKQNGLDDNGFSSIIDFIINGRPEDSQLILSLTDSELNLLSEDYSPIMLYSGQDVMNTEEYQSVKDEIEELVYVKGFALS
jgi:hypothetical protein